MKTLAFSLLSFFICINFINSQTLSESPSLQVGLGGIKFSRGNINAEVVAEIIAEKQKEVKIKLIKNMLLNKIGVDNGLFYAYIDQSIEILTTEKDEDTRIKNLLENTVNIAFVVGYADYYISTLKKGSVEWNSLKLLALTYDSDTSMFNSDQLRLKDFAKINYVQNSNEFYQLDKDAKSKIIKEKKNEFVGVIIDLFAEQIRQNESLRSLGLLRTNYLQNYISMNAYLSLENETPRGFSNKLLCNFHHRLYGDINPDHVTARNLLNSIEKNSNADLDSNQIEILEDYYRDLRILTSSVQYAMDSSRTDIKDDLVVKSESRFDKKLNANIRTSFGPSDQCTYLTFLSGSSKDQERLKLPYKDRQKIYLQMYQDAKFLYGIYETSFKKKDLAETVFNQVGKNLNIYMKYYGLIKSLSNKGNNWKKTLELLSNYFDCGEDTTTYQKILDMYSSAVKEVNKIENLTNQEIKSLEQINNFVDKLQYPVLNRFQYLQIFEKEIKPSLHHLAIYSLDFLEMDKSMSRLLYCIDSNVSADLDAVNINLALPFIEVLTKIDEFDKVETYSTFLNQLSDAGDVFSDEEMRKSINRIITFIRNYIKVSKDENNKLTLNLDVHGFLYSLQKTQYNKYRPLQFHFTLGANTMFFSKNLQLNNADYIRNYSFVGEKIGIKFKFSDYKYTRSFSKGETYTYWNKSYVKISPPKEPIVSNLHVLAYGSGLLYNLVNTGTTKDFNYPLLGVGVGITFFNDLDFNFSWGKPILPSKSFSDRSTPTFLSFGFDIQFLEYYERLNQKRKDNKTQKKLANAVKYEGGRTQ